MASLRSSHWTTAALCTFLGLVLGAGTAIFAAGRVYGADQQQVDQLSKRVGDLESEQRQLYKDVVQSMKELSKSMASMDSKLSGLEPLVKMAQEHVKEDRVLKPSDVR